MLVVRPLALVDGGEAAILIQETVLGCAECSVGVVRSATYIHMIYASMKSSQSSLHPSDNWIFANALPLSAMGFYTFEI
jgi:carbamoylphosphate synthase large subunit